MELMGSWNLMSQQTWVPLLVPTASQHWEWWTAKEVISPKGKQGSRLICTDILYNVTRDVLNSTLMNPYIKFVKLNILRVVNLCVQIAVEREWDRE